MKKIFMLLAIISTISLAEINTDIRGFYRDGPSSASQYSSEEISGNTDRDRRRNNRDYEEIINEPIKHHRNSEIENANKDAESVNERTKQDSTEHVDFSERAAEQMREIKKTVRNIESR